MVKYNLVFFFSEGPPNDNGLNLSQSKDEITRLAKPYFDNIEFYTPSKLKKMGYNNYVKEREMELDWMSPMYKIGNCAWRPLIMLLELKKMKDGDIIVYKDCNTSKAHCRNYTNIRKIIDECLKQFDFFVPFENPSDPRWKLKRFVKTNIIRDLGENHPFCYEFPSCLAGLLTIAKKSKVSLEILNEWKMACEKEEWIDGKLYGELYHNFKWSTNEQAILNVIISNWIRKKKHNIPLNYPNITFECKNTNKLKYNINHDYLKFLNFNNYFESSFYKEKIHWNHPTKDNIRK